MFKTEPEVGARADYLDGDPAAPGPITGGTLAVDSGCLRFSRQGEAELRIGISDLYGITVSGARARRNGFKARARGTTRLAVLRDRRPMVWEFAIDRSHGVALREHLNRALGAIGRPPLPFVEALDGFERPAPSLEPPPDEPPESSAEIRILRRERRPAPDPPPREHSPLLDRPPTSVPAVLRERPAPQRARRAARTASRRKSGVTIESRAEKRQLTPKQRRLIFAGVGAMVFLEIVLPLLILRVF